MDAEIIPNQHPRHRPVFQSYITSLVNTPDCPYATDQLSIKMSNLPVVVNDKPVKTPIAEILSLFCGRLDLSTATPEQLEDEGVKYYMGNYGDNTPGLQEYHAWLHVHLGPVDRLSTDRAAKDLNELNAGNDLVRMAEAGVLDVYEVSDSAPPNMATLKGGQKVKRDYMRSIKIYDLMKAYDLAGLAKDARAINGDKGEFFKGKLGGVIRVGRENVPDTSHLMFGRYPNPNYRTPERVPRGGFDPSRGGGRGWAVLVDLAFIDRIRYSIIEHYLPTEIKIPEQFRAPGAPMTIPGLSLHDQWLLTHPSPPQRKREPKMLRDPKGRGHDPKSLEALEDLARKAGLIKEGGSDAGAESPVPPPETGGSAGAADSGPAPVADPLGPPHEAPPADAIAGTPQGI